MRLKNKFLWIFIAATVLSSGAGRALQDQKVEAVQMSDLTFIAGQWSTERDGDYLEEVWSTPTGDSMMGMFRWIKSGKVWMYEILTIRKEDGGIVFRFRHFSNEFIPWEPKESPLTFKLIRFRDGEAVFENPGQDSPRRYSFIKNGEDGLRVRVQGHKDGKLGEGDIFDYRRQD